MSTLKRNSGFTLIELMITVAVIAILAGVAYPSYTEYAKKGRRADAKAAIAKVQLAEEKWRTNNTSYTNSLANLGFVDESGVFYSPDRHYTLSIISAATNVVSASGTATLNAPSTTTYGLRATRTGLQANDKCGDYAIDQNGVKYLISGTPASGYDVNKCW
jgi:type IV pilus assembly protein PilE